MLAVVWPVSWCLLIPVILVEGYIAKRILHLTWTRSLTVSTKANIASTMMGIPITWLLLFGIQLLITDGGNGYGMHSFSHKLASVTIQAPWLAPFQEPGSARFTFGTHLSWMKVAAALTLSVPFFITSVWAEFLVAKKSLEEDHRSMALRWSMIANLATYGFVAGVLAVAVVWGYPK